jgi:hypothetical protein
MFWLDADGNILQQGKNKTSFIPNSNAQLNSSKPDEIIYKNAFYNTNVRFTQLNDGRKMDVILNDKSALGNIPKGATEFAISEDIIIPDGWSVKSEYYTEKNLKGKIQTISIYDIKGTEILRYLPPFCFEKDNKDSIKNEIYYKYSLSGNKLNILTIVPAEWLNKSERKFPIVIDPTVNCPVASGTSTCRIYSDCSAFNAGEMRLGLWDDYYSTWVYAFAAFNLSGIPSGSTINSASFNCYIYQTSYRSANQAALFSAVNFYSPATCGYVLNNSGDNGNAYSPDYTGWNLTGWTSASLASNGPGLTDIANNAGGTFYMCVYPTGSFSGIRVAYIRGYDAPDNNFPYLQVGYTVTVPCSPTPTYPSNTFFSDDFDGHAVNPNSCSITSNTWNVSCDNASGGSYPDYTYYTDGFKIASQSGCSNTMMFSWTVYTGISSWYYPCDNNSPPWNYGGVHTEGSISGPVVYTLVDASNSTTGIGYSGMTVSFDWICGGQTDHVYGRFGYVLTNEDVGGCTPYSRCSCVNWLSNKFSGQTSWQTFSYNLPSYLDNHKFWIVFEFYRDASGNNPTAPGFSFDNVIVTGTANTVTFPSQPSNTAVCPGNSASFTASLVSGCTNGCGALSYKWQVSSNGGSTWSNITSAGTYPTYSNWTSTTLGLSGVAASNNGLQYRYIAVSCSGSGVATTNAATLTVKGITVQPSAPPTVISCSGLSVTSISFTANNSPSSYQWQVNTGSGWADITAPGSLPDYAGYNSSNTLNINHVVVGNNGYQYRCNISYADPPTCPATSNAATLSVTCPCIGQ